MITFIIHIKAGPGNGPALEAVLSHVRDLTLLHEPGVAYYDFAQNPDEPDSYVVVEVYRSAEAHASHMQTAWVMESIPQTQRLVSGRFDIRQYVSPGTPPAARRFQEA